MKRYFTTEVRPDPQTYRPRGLYHFIDLPAGGHIVVVIEENSEVPAWWTPLPHLLDPSAAGFNGTHAKLGEPARPGVAPIAGCSVHHSTFMVARNLGAHVAFFAP